MCLLTRDRKRALSKTTSPLGEWVLTFEDCPRTQDAVCPWVKKSLCRLKKTQWPRVRELSGICQVAEGWLGQGIPESVSEGS